MQYQHFIFNILLITIIYLCSSSPFDVVAMETIRLTNLILD